MFSGPTKGAEESLANRVKGWFESEGFPLEFQTAHAFRRNDRRTIFLDGDSCQLMRLPAGWDSPLGVKSGDITKTDPGGLGKC